MPPVKLIDSEVNSLRMAERFWLCKDTKSGLEFCLNPLVSPLMIGVVYWGSDLQSTAKGEIIKMSTGEKEK